MRRYRGNRRDLIGSGVRVGLEPAFGKAAVWVSVVALLAFVTMGRALPGEPPDSLSVRLSCTDPGTPNVRRGPKGGADFRGGDASLSASPGDPGLPLRTVRLILPPDADLRTVALRIERVQRTLLEGQYDVLPAPPLATWNNGRQVLCWGDGKRIVDDRNAQVYEKDALYPARCVRFVSAGQMRKWRICEVAFYPYQYNPTTQRLYAVEDVRLTLTYRRAKGRLLGAREKALLAETAGEERVRWLCANYGQAQPWYGAGTPGASNVKAAAEYVIVTTSAIQAASTQLAAFVGHKQTMGFSVRVVTEADWGGGVGDAAAENIRLWLKNNYALLGIQYVLLVGNPHPDDGDVPMKMLWPRRNYSSDRDAPADFYYGDLTGNWDLDADGYFGECYDDWGPGGIDRLSEVTVGRIPYYGSASDLDGILQKTMAYATTPVGETLWRRRALLPMEPMDRRTLSYHLGEAIKDDGLVPQGFGCYRLYDGYYGLPQPAEHIPCDSSPVLSAWQSERPGLVFWMTHGSSSGASGVFYNSLCSSLDDAYPVFTFQGSCHNGYPERDYNLAYSILRQGGVGTVAASRVSWYYIGRTTYVNSPDIGGMCYAYAQQMVVARDCAGDALRHIKETLPCSGGTLWMNFCVFNLYGDPALGIDSAQQRLYVATASPLPTAYVGQPYTVTLTAAAGTPAYTWSVGAGGLPAGLPLDSATGQITGVAGAAGVATFTAVVTDAVSQTASRAFQLPVVHPASLTVRVEPPGAGETTPSAGVHAVGPVAWVSAQCQGAGKCFKRWEDEHGALVSYRHAITVTVAGDRTLVAVYEDVTQFHVNDATPEGGVAAGDNAFPGTSVQAPMASIEQLLLRYPEIGAGCTINVAPGTYTEDIRLDASRSGLALVGAGRDVTIVDGGNDVRCLRLDGFAEGLVTGFTFQDGWANYGAGIYCENGSSPTISANRFAGHYATAGGAVYCKGSSPAVLNNVLVRNNVSAYAGAICCWANSSPRIAGNTIVSNYADCGAAIYCYGGSPLIEGNLIADNHGRDAAGGIRCYGSPSPVVLMNTIVGNSTGGYAGGMHCDSSEMTVAHNLIVGNAAGTHSGGIYCAVGVPDIAHNTVADNSATEGGGIHCLSGASPTITNCILWANGDDLSACSATYSCVEDGDPGLGNIAADPLFVNYTGGTWTAYPNRDYDQGQTTFEDSDASWAPDALAGLLLNPDTLQNRLFPIVSNTARAVTVWGNACSSGMGSRGALYQIRDYRLMSQAEGDGQTSPCIDAGSPASDFSNEPDPNGGRANMGAFGGTSEASRTPDAALHTLRVACGGAGRGQVRVGHTVRQLPFSGTFADGSEVALEAFPDEGTSFRSWSGDLIGVDNPASIPMDGEKAVTVTFGSVCALTITVSPADAGTTTPSAGAHLFDRGVVVPLSAHPKAGYGFSRWLGPVGNPASPTTEVAMDGAKSVTAVFVLRCALTLGVDDPAHGATAPPPGTYWHDQGSMVAVAAVASHGYVFHQWLGGVASPSAASTTVSMTSDKTVTATFLTRPCRLVVKGAGEGKGGVVVNGALHALPHWEEFGTDTTVTLSAQAAPGCGFVGWAGALSGTASPCVLVMDDDKAVAARFEPKVKVLLSTEPKAFADVYVDGLPQDAPHVTSWLPGTVHTLGVDSVVTVTLRVRLVFMRWSHGFDRVHDLVAPKASNEYTAHFRPEALVTTAVNPVGAGTVTLEPASPGGWYEMGSRMRFTGVPGAGYRWWHWDFGAVGKTKANPIVLTVPKAGFHGIANMQLVSGSMARAVPIAPVGEVTAGAVRFTWQGVDCATAYDVWVSAGRAQDCPVLVTRGLVQTRTDPVAGLTQGSYTWWVKANAAKGRSSWSLPAEFAMRVHAVVSLVSPDPIVPKGQVGAGQVTFTWTQVPGATGYDLWVASAGSTCPAFRRLNLAGADCAVVLKPGTYRWAVRAWSNGVASPWSAVAEARVK